MYTKSLLLLFAVMATAYGKNYYSVDRRSDLNGQNGNNNVPQVFFGQNGLKHWCEDHSDCASSNTMCSNNHCICKPNYQESGSSGCNGPLNCTLGQINCGSWDGWVCDQQAGRCVCNEETHSERVNTGFCVPNEGPDITCSNGQGCQGGRICVQNRCRCPPNTYPTNTGDAKNPTCQQYSCGQDRGCAHTWDTHRICQGGRCICDDPKYRETNTSLGQICAIGMEPTCGRDFKCTDPNEVCVDWTDNNNNGKCQCKANYYHEDGRCQAYRCQDQPQQSGQWVDQRAKCNIWDENRECKQSRCECKEGYDQWGIEGGKCLKSGANTVLSSLMVFTLVTLFSILN